MDVTKSKGAVEFVMIEMSDVPYRDRHGQEPSGGWIEGSVPKEHRESWSGVSKKMNPIRFEAKLVAKYHDSPGISEEYGLHLCSDSIRFVGQAKAGEFKHFAEDASETAYLDDPVFGTIEFAEEEPGLGVWEAEDEVEFGKHHGEPWRASVTVLAPDTGPTKEQRETFKELLKRYKKLWPKIAEALAVEHHRDDLTVGDIDNAVNHIISFEVQEDEGDGVVIEIQYTLDLEDEGDMGYFVAIRDWKAEPAGAAD